MILTSFRRCCSWPAARAAGRRRSAGCRPSCRPCPRARCTGFFFSEKKRVRVLLRAGGEALDRDLLRRGQHQRRAGRELAHLVAPDATIATPSMLGPPGWIETSTPSCVVVAELLGDDFADLVAAGEPAQLQVDVRLVRGERVDRDDAACGCQAAGQQRGLEHLPALRIEVRHDKFRSCEGWWVERVDRIRFLKSASLAPVRWVEMNLGRSWSARQA